MEFENFVIIAVVHFGTFALVCLATGVALVGLIRVAEKVLG